MDTNYNLDQRYFNPNLESNKTKGSSLTAFQSAVIVSIKMNCYVYSCHEYSPYNGCYTLRILLQN